MEFAKVTKSPRSGEVGIDHKWLFPHRYFIYLFIFTHVRLGKQRHPKVPATQAPPTRFGCVFGAEQCQIATPRGAGRRAAPQPQPALTREGDSGKWPPPRLLPPPPPRLAELLSSPLSDWPAALSSPCSALRLAEGADIKPPLSTGRLFLAGRTRCCVLHTKLRPFHPGDWHRAPPPITTPPPHHGLRLRARLHLLRPHPARRRSHRHGECKAPAPQDGGRPRHGGGGLLLPLLLPSEPSPQRRPRCRRTKLTPSSRRPESPWSPFGRGCSQR